MQTRKLEVIQALRGMAAMLVVLMHFRPYLDASLPSLSQVLSHGYLGVDIFFVVSGFIIYVSTSEPASRDGTGFLIRRLCRVVLPAWVAMALLVVVRPPRLIDLIQGVLFIPLQNVEPPFYGHSFLVVAWTLTYELIFYTVFAAVLYTTAGRKHRGLLASMAIACMLLVVQLSLGKLTLDAHDAPMLATAGRLPVQLISLLGNPILLEFIVGIFLAWAYLGRHFHVPPALLRGVLLTAPPVLVLS